MWGDGHIRNVRHYAIKTETEVLHRLMRNPPHTWWSQMESLKEAKDELTPASQVEGEGGRSR